MVRLASGYGDREWTLPPPVPLDWVDLPSERAGLLVHRLAEVVGGASALPLTIEAIRVAPLDFYPGWLLCDFQAQVDGPADKVDAAIPSIPSRVTLSYVYGHDGFTPLDGRSLAIHNHNAMHGLDLSTDTGRKNYLRFFCYFVRGEAGPFELRDNADGLDFGGDRMQATNEMVTEAIKPLSHDDAADADGVYYYTASMVYAGQIFATRFALKQPGLIEMVDDTPLIGGVSSSPPIGHSGNTRFLLEAPPATESKS